jgi:PAS domain S-box-containing protein
MDSTTVSIAYGNKPAGLVVAFDVTERKQAEEALRKSEEKFAKAFRSSPVAIAVTRLHDGRILDANEAMLKLLHFTADEVIGHTTRDLDIWVDVNDRAQFTQMLATAGPVRDLEYRLRTKDGAIVTIHLSAELLEVSGEPCMLSTLVDVTERQRAAEALRQEKTFTDKLLNAPRDTVFLFEPATGQPVRWNKRFAEVSGYDDDEIAGMKAPDDFYDESDLRKAREAMVKIATGGQGVVELSLVTKRGVHIPFEYAATVVETEDGRTLLLSIGRDITERKQAEQALRELNATLETRVAERTAELEHRARQLQKLTLELTEADERERQRLAEILHDDLQQVLAAAKFHVGLLDGRVRDDTESQEIVGQARDLLVDAITKSRSLSHELSAPVLSRSDLCEAFEWLAEQMQTKHRFTVHLDLGGRMELASEPLRVLLYKAAQELLFNAIKHAGVHEATLRLRHRRGRTWLFVSDQGRGFDSRGLGKASGFGLLSIRERVEYLGGRLKIRSVPGKGSIFAVAVPDSDVRESAFPREAPSAPSGAPATEE